MQRLYVCMWRRASQNGYQDPVEDVLADQQPDDG